MFVYVFQAECNVAHIGAGHHEGASRQYDNDRCADGKRFNQNQYRQQQQHNAAKDSPSAAAYTECAQIAGEPDDHETVVQHPKSKYEGQNHQRNIWFAAQKNAQQHIDDAAHDDIAACHEIVATIEREYQLHKPRHHHSQAEKEA